MLPKIALVLSIELFVLISAIFLLAYITKQGMGKWFTYSAKAIIIFIIGMMICSFIAATYMRHKMHEGMKECMEGPECHEGMMMKHPPMMRVMMHKRMCKEGREECEEMRECEGMGECEEGGCEGESKCDMPCCKHDMGKEKCMEKEMHFGKDSMPRKEVIIKKK